MPSIHKRLTISSSAIDCSQGVKEGTVRKKEVEVVSKDADKDAVSASKLFVYTDLSLAKIELAQHFLHMHIANP